MFSKFVFVLITGEKTEKVEFSKNILYKQV